MRPVSEPIRDVLGVTAVQAETHERIGRLQLGNHICHERHGRRLAAADAHLTRECVARDAELRLGSICEVDDLFGAGAQPHTCLCELDASFAAHEERAAQLAFEFLHLARERWLRDVQRRGGTGDGALAGDHEEAPQCSNFHIASSVRVCVSKVVCYLLYLVSALARVAYSRRRF